MDTDPDQTKILIIDHPDRGCSNNLIALGLALSSNHTMNDLEIVRCRIRLQILRHIMMPLLCIIPAHNKFFRALWQWIFFTGERPSKNDYDIVLSYLRIGETPSVFYKHIFKAQSIHVSTPRSLPAHRFDTIIANPGIDAKPGERTLAIPPTRFTYKNLPDDRRDAFANTLCDNTQYAAMLIGGPAPDVNYSDAYWDSILDFLDTAETDQNIKWLVTTSPRTPHRFTERLKDLYDKPESPIADLNIFTGSSESMLLEYLHFSSITYVTAESVSMIADAMAFDTPVVVINEMGCIKNKRIQGALNSLEKHGYISNLDICADRATHNIEALLSSYKKRPLWPEKFQEIMR